MTTIVAVARNNKLAIAADTQVSSNHSRMGCENKLVVVGDNIGTIIGVAGPQTALLAITEAVGDLELDWSSQSAVYRSVLALHDDLKTNHYLMVNEEENQPFESIQCQLLIINTTGVYQVSSFREVLAHGLHTEIAIGSGDEYAMGFMHAAAVFGQKYDEYPEDLAKAAVQAAARFDLGTNDIVDVEMVELGEDENDDEQDSQ